MAVATARQLLGDGYLSILVTRGTDVLNVARAGRAVHPDVDAALVARDPKCCVPGCEVAEPLERDHRVLPFADGGATTLENLARLCKWHHYLRTHRGWRLEGKPGSWTWAGPTSDRDTKLDASLQRNDMAPSADSGGGGPGPPA